jgi:hypothetical protein
VTRDELQDIRSRWSLRAKSPDLASSDVVAQAASDIERLVKEVQRLEASCHEITLQYARLCQGCSNSGNGLCPIAV